MKETREGREMGKGTLEVQLVNARSLEDNNFLGKIFAAFSFLFSLIRICAQVSNMDGKSAVKMEPYVLIQYGNQVRWSSVAKGQPLPMDTNNGPCDE